MNTLMGFKNSLRSTLLGVCALAALGAGSVQGASLGLTLLPSPDIYATSIAVEYDADTDTLTAIGLASELDGANITNGSFSLTANITAAGALGLSGGSINITGNGGTLLTGALTDFGFPDGGGNPLEFLFNVTSGTVSSQYGGLPGGIILGASGFGGSWTVDWKNFTTDQTGNVISGANGVADIAPVPLPAAAWLFGSAMVGLLGFRRRQRS